MATPKEERSDLPALLDEAGRWCQPCHKGWDRFTVRLSQTRQAPAGEVSDLCQPGPIARGSRRWPAGRRVWLAGAACTSALILFVAMRLFGPATALDSQEPSAQAVPRAEQPAFRVALADDCRIEPVGDAFYQVVEPRRVRLDHGELYVSVGPGTTEQDPFIVETPAGEARGSASSFVVETRSVKPEVKVPEKKGDRTMATHFGNNMRALTQVLVLAGAVQLVGSEESLEGRSGEVLASETTPPAKAVPRLSIPGFWMLSTPQAIGEVGLTGEQVAKLQELSSDYQEQVRGVWADFHKLTVEERKDQMKATQQTTQEIARLTFEQARKLLTSDQIDKLKTIQLRTRGWAFLQADRYHEPLGITARQKEELSSIFSEMQKKFTTLQDEMRKTREDSFEKALEILDPEQVEKLKELGMGQQMWWQRQDAGRLKEGSSDTGKP